ncbi:hypothetical protein [Blastomonas sp.]|uniref:hypothetical protein n=1 Tax=Blastomonas sp. TaxID=1909299 RepID=UPI003593FBEF
MALRRDQLQKLAEAKLIDGQILLDARRFSSAYYLGGYAIELGLKACAAKQVLAETIPDKAFGDKIYTHDFLTLVRLAGLARELRAAQDADRRFQANWGIVAEWSPNVRYEVVEAMSAQLLIQAVVEMNHGVMQWIKMHW